MRSKRLRERQRAEKEKRVRKRLEAKGYTVITAPVRWEQVAPWLMEALFGTEVTTEPGAVEGTYIHTLRRKGSRY